MSYPQLKIYFHPDEIDFPNQLKSDETQLFATVCEKASYTYNHKEYIYLEYRFEYDANGAIGCGYCCFPQSSCLGYHTGDKENLILLTNEEYQIQYVFFKAHGRGQGMWLPFEHCHKTHEGILKAYVARASHAFYPRPKIYLRIFGFANDLCSRRGRRSIVVASGNHQEDLVLQKRSITPVERFFLPFLLKYIRTI